MVSSPFRRFVATALAVCLAALVAPVPLLADDPAVFQGRVFDADGASPLAGVVVRLVEPGTMAVVDSPPTGDDGAFRLEATAREGYTLLARHDERVFLAASDLRLDPGANDPVALTLEPAASLAPAQAVPVQGQSGLPMWGKIAIAGGIGVATLFVINDVNDSANVPASPFR